jgi:hypothetical protein
VSAIYHTQPFTLDANVEIPAGAPLGMAMTQAQADAVAAAAQEQREIALHLHADVAGSDVTISVANSPIGSVYWLDFGDGSGARIEHAEESSDTSATHTYLTDGVFTAVLNALEGPPEGAQLQIDINCDYLLEST